MNVPLSLSIALILFSCYGNVSSNDEEEEKSQSSYSESTTSYYDYDYNATFEYYFVNHSFIGSNETFPESDTMTVFSSCRSITDRLLLISSLLLSLAALFH